MKRHKEGFSEALKLILKGLKKKKTIAILTIAIVGYLFTSFLISMNRDKIREQQIESVAKTTFKNKQFKSVRDGELDKLLKSSNQKIVAIIDAKDNKGYKELKKMFNQNKQVEELPKTVYVYQPIYENSETIKNLNLKNKNNFLLIQNGKEQARYSFDELSNGERELTEQVDLMIDPKIPQKKPIRVEKKEELSFDQNPNNGTRTSEVEFE